ncbi:MAG: ferrous iron transport protein A [Nitrosomonadales bacterium]|jgi:ferrous iron transport protein A|nr:ferrous iron transport protein A [Nitrosomonadales bacterium]MBT3918462.1 ferrous iron transport protein A [Nitrosomonadales bacterium]MBT4183558.1 ferrous iron transport protein A [Nitrosomonadales bacterium]MBT4759381.1 ferrous iron transport protein A [Nitrosomonadales bacterium]MBT5150245.1 ferrous iron transport protein A [Nitrosomonadales bacterium]
MTLSELSVNKIAIVEGFASKTPFNDRLIALGIKKNKEIKILRKSRLNGPLHVEVGVTQLMLRELVAEEIIISQL